jgi:hypothetical protein
VTDEKELTAAASEIVALLQGVTRALTLYAPNNDTVTRLVDDLVVALEGHFAGGGEPFHLQLLAQEFFLNGQLLKLDPATWERATMLAEKLIMLEANDLRFDSELKREGIVAFVADLAKSLPAKKNLFHGSYGGLEVSHASGIATATFRFEADKLAVWLYTSLVELIATLYKEHAEGRAPSLVPLKRTLQLAIDNMATHGAIFQVLTTLHRPGLPPSQPMIRTAVAVEAIGFGLWLGLPRQHLLNLGLAGVMSGIVETKDPDLAVQPIFRYPGLGASAVALALVVHDTRSVRAGGDSGVLGRLLGMVESYIEVTLPRESRTRAAPFKALKAMRKGRLPWIEPDLIDAFCDYKGPMPLGSLVRLSSGELGLVLGRPDPPAPSDRPLLGIIKDGKVEGGLDLAQQPDISIAKILTAEQAGVELFADGS